MESNKKVLKKSKSDEELLHWIEQAFCEPSAEKPLNNTEVKVESRQTKFENGEPKDLENICTENQIKKPRPNLWTYKEKVILVGNVYHFLFTSPNLNSELWSKIYKAFVSECFKNGVQSGLTRSESGIKRFFKDLKVQNRLDDGKFFRTLHAEWKRLNK
eukprot:snap_masked-scaffold_11-processed-gene-8.32-mRNA-1 protein AED:1.00 eAED:1.00 QI:0/-1/0/0/-1/1/1/0/158